MNVVTSPVTLSERGAAYVRRERFEIDQYVRVRVTDTRYSIGVVTGIDEDHDRATVETRNGYEVTVPISALRRAFLVVLDLNGVLVARGRGSFVLRPHVLDFLKFVFSNFVVAVWTSGLQRSSNPIIEHVFGNYRDLLLFTLFRDACVPKPTADNPYGTEKNLQFIFDRYPQSFHSVNTIIIDDSPDKCSHPDIALCPIPFKDPVAQGQDEGLVQTMEVLKEVLLLDSGVPLIHAAEQRLRQLAEQQHYDPESGMAASSGVTDTAQGSGGAAAPTSPSAPAAATASRAGPSSGAAHGADASSGDSHEMPSDMEEVELWKTRLCCENLMGRCTRNGDCPFSHDADDGRPCSRKSGCRAHGHRWPKTREETQLEEQRRQARREAQAHFDEMQEQREARLRIARQPQPEPHKTKSPLGAGGGILAAASGVGGGGGVDGRQARRGGNRRRGGDGRQSAFDNDEDDDWSRETTGFSHTGDPAYDNMMDQQRRSKAAAGPAAAAAAAAPRGSMQSSLARAWHLQSSRAAAAPPPQQQQVHQPFVAPQSASNQSSVSLFFQTAAGGNAGATYLEPFSTRPIPAPAAPSPSAAPAESRSILERLQQQQQQPQHRPSSSTALDTAGPRRGNAPMHGGGGQVMCDEGHHDESQQRQQRSQQQQQQQPQPSRQQHARQAPQQQQRQAGSLAAPQQAAIHITGNQRDSNAVVNQLQALLKTR